MPVNQMIQTIMKTRKSKNRDDNESEKEQKTPGIGTVLYVYQDGELTEEDQAEVYTKWTTFAGSLSVSPLLLNTEEAKTDEDSENIRIRVWEKLSSELTDLTVFAWYSRRNHIYKGERIMDDSFLARSFCRIL